MNAYVLEKSAKAPTLVSRPAPTPAPGEIAVQTLAVAIHPVDLETASGGNAMMLPMKRPFVPGCDLVGAVAALGDGVSDLSVGEVVYAYRGVPVQGAFAEQVCLPRADVARAPTGYTVERLATLPLPALCALQALDDTGTGAGASVLVHGGAGGVGSIAVQVFAASGLTVTATASARDADWVRELGAQEVIDYKATRFEDVVQGADLVFDTVGGDTLKRSMAAVRPGGAVVSLSAMPTAAALRSAGMAVPTVLGWIVPLMGWGNQRRARSAGARLVGQVTVQSGARLDRLTAIATQRQLDSRVDRVFPWDALPAAMAHAGSGEARGRVVVTRSTAL